MTDTRFKTLALDQMSPEQRRIAERRIAGPKQKVGAPLNVLIRSAGLADHVERISEHFRVQKTLPERLKQLAIALVARHWTAQYPWTAHYPMALAAGISAAVLNQIAAGERPAGLQADEAAVHDFCKSLLEEKTVSDGAFAAVRDRYGEAGVVDLIGLLGYYCMVCMALVVDRYPPVANQAPVLKPLPGRMPALRQENEEKAS
ncbi:MAG: carboxymuconolactone decarboxylase family protein [Betaproteobacteria bacterium]|nr:carboxymuconolactone decarboxylase family protein [Betaproteobacteria bacterium]